MMVAARNTSTDSIIKHNTCDIEGSKTEGYQACLAFASQSKLIGLVKRLHTSSSMRHR